MQKKARPIPKTGRKPSQGPPALAGRVGARLRLDRSSSCCRGLSGSVLSTARCMEGPEKLAPELQIWPPFQRLIIELAFYSRGLCEGIARVFAGFLHHCHELIEIDHAVVVLVIFLDHLGDLVLQVALDSVESVQASVAEHDREVILRDGAAVVPVELFENLPDTVVAVCHLLVHRCSHELAVIDLPAAVRVQRHHHLREVRR